MGLFGGKSSSSSSATNVDADFADFATSSVSTVVSAVTSIAASAASNLAAAEPTAQVVRPSIYGDEHPWYAFWKRTSPSDFYVEYFILGFLTTIVSVHFIGSSWNRSLARKWLRQHIPALQREYARVGFQRVLTTSEQAAPKVASGEIVGKEADLTREEAPDEYVHYSTGRMNIISTVFNIKLQARQNPFYLISDYVMSFFFDTVSAPSDTVTITSYPSDGADAAKTGGHSSKYDGFVWAVVNKRTMARWRLARYDMSLTKTVDSPKLPAWLTVFTESAEITDLFLTKELISALEQVGPNFQYLLITDQPLDKPLKSSELNGVKKRLILVTDIEGQDKTVPLVEYFLRLPDFLVSNAHFRPEVMRKLRATRDEERRVLEKKEEEEESEQRLIAKDQKKQQERDNKLRGLSAEQQKKFLEKEKEKDARKQAKKASRRG